MSVMSRVKSSTLWLVYYAVYLGGFATLMNQTRTPAASSAAFALPFALPPILVWIAAMADRAEALEPPAPAPGPVSVVTGRPTHTRHAARTLSVAALMFMTPFTNWVFPEQTAPALRFAFLVLMLLCAAFAALVIPRLQPRVDGA
jgi:hypothetical protein